MGSLATRGRTPPLVPCTPQWWSNYATRDITPTCSTTADRSLLVEGPRHEDVGNGATANPQDHRFKTAPKTQSPHWLALTKRYSLVALPTLTASQQSVCPRTARRDPPPARSEHLPVVHPRSLHAVEKGTS